MRLVLKCLLACAVLFSVQAFAKTEEVKVRATGFGDRPEVAAANALVEAGRQGLGVSVMLDPNFRTDVFEWVETEKVVSGSVTSRPEAKAPTLANIVSYNVLSTSKVDDKLWKVEVEAVLLKNKSVGKDKSALPSIVVAPVRTHEASYSLGEQVSAAELAGRMQREMVQSLSQSGRFRALDRSYPKEVLKELAVSASGLSPFEHAKLGQQLGADLIVTTDVEKFQLGRDGNTFYDSKLQGLEPYIRINYQLIDVATQEIVTAGTWVDKQSQSAFRASLRKEDIEPAREPDRMGEVLYPYVARHLTGEVTDVLYPLRVLSAQAENAIYVTQGSGRLGEGDLLSAHTQGESIADPDSGIAIRLAGPAVATLRVTEVAQEYAVTELVTGDIGALSDTVLKVEAAPDEAPVGVERPMTPGSSDKPIQW